MAARGAGAAGRADAAHRRAHGRARADDPEGAGRRRGVRCRCCSNWAGPSVATCGSTSAGPQAMPPTFARHAAELAALAPDVILASGAASRGAIVAGDPHRADRVRQTSPIRSAPALSTAWRGRAATPPALLSSNTASSGEMAGAAQGNCAKRDPSGGPSRPCNTVRNRPVRRDPVRGAVARSGGEPGQRPRRRRDRARCRGLRALRRMAA